MIRFAPLLVLLLCSMHVNALNNFRFLDARSISMSGAALFNQDIWTVQNNPSLLGTLKHRSFGIASNYLVEFPEIQSFSAISSWPTYLLNFAVYYSNYGNKLVQEHHLGVTLARQFGELFTFGLNLDHYTNEFSREVQNSYFFSFQISGTLLLPSEYKLAVHALNPLANEVDSQSVPSTYRIGVSKQYYGSLHLSLEIGQYNAQHTALRFGMDYEVLEHFFLRLGTVANQQILSTGLGYKWQQLQIDCGYQHRFQIGSIASLSGSYDF